MQYNRMHAPFMRAAQMRRGNKPRAKLANIFKYYTYIQIYRFTNTVFSLSFFDEQRQIILLTNFFFRIIHTNYIRIQFKLLISEESATSRGLINFIWYGELRTIYK